jgi:DNA polymerase III psi subunit
MESTALSRLDTLRALGVMPLRLRACETNENSAVATVECDKRIALLRSQEEIEQAPLAMLYTKITEAISTLGLQCVRIADAEADPRVRVLAFGDAPLPPAIDAGRVLRVDALAVLHADRGRKRALWDRLQELVQERR